MSIARLESLGGITNISLSSADNKCYRATGTVPIVTWDDKC